MNNIIIKLYFLINQVFAESLIPPPTNADDEIVPFDLDDYDESDPHEYEEFKHNASLLEYQNGPYNVVIIHKKFVLILCFFFFRQKNIF